MLVIRKRNGAFMNIRETGNILSVTELTQSIKKSLELQYRFIHIQGEVSNLRTPYSGHSYFTLKDSSAQIRAVLFKNQKKFLQSPLKEGQNIICHGRLSVYMVRGEYQIIVDTIDLAGRGSLQVQFEKLKRALAEEGLFDQQRKKKIPAFPDHIVLITSSTGAAVHDFLKIAAKRNFWGRVSILPVAVQGRQSSSEIAAAFGEIDNIIDADIAVVLRGGGSLEDLWSFNEEQTARAISQAIIPVVTGIGHETDYTIADMCADLHTHTPTAAAEAIVPDAGLIAERVCHYKKALLENMTHTIEEHEEAVHGLRRVMGNLDLFLANHALKLDYRFSSLLNAGRRKIEASFVRFENVTKKLHHHAPLNKISIQKQKLETVQRELPAKLYRILEKKEEHLARQAALLDSVSPLSVLARGYAIVQKDEGEAGQKTVISDAEQVENGDIVGIRLHRGALQCEVIRKEEDGAS